MLIDLSEILSLEGKTQVIEAPVSMDSFQSKLGSFPVKDKEPVILTITNTGKKMCIRDRYNSSPCASQRPGEEGRRYGLLLCGRLKRCVHSLVVEKRKMCIRDRCLSFQG